MIPAELGKLLKAETIVSSTARKKDRTVREAQDVCSLNAFLTLQSERLGNLFSSRTEIGDFRYSGFLQGIRNLTAFRDVEAKLLVHVCCGSGLSQYL